MYRPEIDGLRSVAVLSVVFYHADARLLGGGYIGVDVFFVISGFLITSLLLNDMRRNSFSLANFYERRCRRILPPLVVMALIVTALGWFFLLPADYRDFGSSLKGAASFTANHYFFGKAGYFDAVAFTKPLLHTWSLSVEEQFYIVFPILLWFLCRYRPAALAKVLGALFALSLAAAGLMTFPWPDAAFYLLPARFWELLAGALLVLWPERARPKGLAADLASRAGLGAIAASAIFYNDSTAFPGFAALPPCLGAALFILANSPGSRRRASLLSRPVPVWIGKISYSLYLWHWPLLVIPRYVHDAPLTPGMTAAALTGAFVMAYLSWRWVENPIRGRKILPGRRDIFLAAGLSLLLLIGIGHGIRKSAGFINRLPMPARQYSLAARDGYDAPPWEVYHRRIEKHGVRYEFKAWDINPEAPQAFMIMGNSHAHMWLEAVDGLALEYGLGGQAIDRASYGACSLIDPDEAAREGEWSCNGLLNALLDQAQERGLKNVLLVIRYLPALGGEVKAQRPVGEWEPGPRQLLRGLEATLEAARKRGLTLWLLESVPEYETSVSHTLTRLALKGLGPEDLAYDLKYYENRSAPLMRRRQALEVGGLKFLKVTEAICPGRLCRPGDEHGSFYTDDNHLSRYGARRFRQVLAPFFESLTQAGGNERFGGQADFPPTGQP